MISSAFEDLIGFALSSNGATGAKLHVELEDDDDEDALSVLFLVVGATVEDERLPWGGSTGEGDLLICLALYGSGDTRGEGATVSLSGPRFVLVPRLTGKEMREILPEGWRLNSL